ncbi:MAG TPA: hypothetical protein VGF30_13840 [Bacteroidia bacterium]
MSDVIFCPKFFWIQYCSPLYDGIMQQWVWDYGFRYGGSYSQLAGGSDFEYRLARTIYQLPVGQNHGVSIAYYLYSK